MAKAAVSPKSSQKVWQFVAIASVVLNAGLIGGYLYLLHFNQFPLLQTQASVRCSEPGYSRFIRQYEQKDKKIAAALECFKDYDTGKSLDINSLKPAADKPASLPAKP